MTRRTTLLVLATMVCTVSALQQHLHGGCAKRRAPPLRRSAAGSERSHAPVCGQRDELVLSGDVAVLVLYGAIQGAVDVSMAPMATTQPELFDLLVGPPVTLPSLQTCVLAALWASIGIVLGDIDALDPYDIKKTRGVSPVAAAAAALAPWAATVLLTSVLLSGLQTAFQLGPGLSKAELDFLAGSYVVVGGWRVVVNSVLPSV